MPVPSGKDGFFHGINWEMLTPNLGRRRPCICINRKSLATTATFKIVSLLRSNPREVEEPHSRSHIPYVPLSTSLGWTGHRPGPSNVSAGDPGEIGWSCWVVVHPGHPEGRMVLALVLVFIWIHFLPSNTGVCGVLSESIDTGTRTFQSRCP